MSYNARILDLIEQACDISAKSSMRTKHGAILLRNNKAIVGTSYNSYPHHAESNVIRKSAKVYDIRRCVNSHAGMTVVVAKKSRTGQYSNSKPCLHCVQSMIKANIKYVIYTTGTDELYRIERPSDIITSHISSGNYYRNRNWTSEIHS